MVFHDALGDGQAQPGASLLGGEEGDEDVLPYLRGNAGPVVGDLDLYGPLAPVLRGRQVAGLDDYPPLAGHGFGGVAQQVQQYLGQLLRVGGNGGQVVDQLQAHLDVLVLAAGGEQLAGMFHQAIGIYLFQLQLQGTGVVQKLVHHPVQAVAFLDDDMQKLGGLAAGRGRVEVLGGALDGSQRVADLVGQAGGHLSQYRQAIALANAFEHLRVLDIDGGLFSHRHEPCDFLGGIAGGTGLVEDVPQAENVALADQRHADAGSQVRQGGQYLAGVLDRGRWFHARQDVLLGQYPFEGLGQDHGGSFTQLLEKSTVGVDIDPLGWLGAAKIAAQVSRAAFLLQVDAGPVEAQVLVEGVEHEPGHFVQVDDVGDVPAQLLQLAFQLEAFPEEQQPGASFHLVTQRFEEDENDERGHEGVKQRHRRRGSGQQHQQPENDGQDQGDGDENQPATQQLLDVQQAVLEQALAQEVQEEQRYQVSPGAQEPQRTGQHAQQDEGHRHQHDHLQDAQAGLFPLRGHLLAAHVHHPGTEVQADEDVADHDGHGGRLGAQGSEKHHQPQR